MKHYLVSYYLAPLEFDEARLPNCLGDFGVGLVDFLGCIEWCLGLRMKGRGKEEEEGENIVMRFPAYSSLVIDSYM